MADLKIQGEVSVSTEKAEAAFDRVGNKASQMASGVERSATQAGKAVDTIGAGAERGAENFTRAESKIRDSILRSTRQLEQLGKTASQKIEMRIETQGLDASKFDPFLARLREVEREAKRAEGGLSGLSNAATMAVRAFAALGVGISARAFIQTADSVTVLNNQLKLATGSTEAASDAYNELFQIAQRSRVSFIGLGSTYASIARATGDLGISQQRLLTVTESIGNAMTISGGSAQSMQAALVQLSQGFASGTLRGEELNSVMEQTPRLAQAIADGLKISRGELRQMGQEGRLTAEAVVKALESQSAVLKNEVAGATLTVGQAFTQLSDSTTKMIGGFDSASGATRTLASALSSIASGMNTLGRSFSDAEPIINSTMKALAGGAALASLAALPRAFAAVGGAVTALGAVLAANPLVLALMGIGVVAGGVGAIQAYRQTADGIRNTIDALEKDNVRAQKALDWSAGMGGAYQAGDDRTRKLIEERRTQIQQLRQELSKLEADNVKGAGGGRGSVNPATIAQMNAEQAKHDASLTEARRKLLGVNKDYEAQLVKLNELREAGVMSEAEYIQHVNKLATETYNASATGREAAESLKASGRGAKEASDSYKQLISSINEKIATESASLSQADKLTASQQLSIRLDEQLASGKVKLTTTQRTEVQQRIAILESLERESAARARAEEFQRRQIWIWEAEVKAQEAILKARQSATKSVEDSLQKARDEERAHALAASTGITLAEAIERLSLARAEENYQKEVGAGADGATLLALQQEIEARKGLITVMQDRGVREANAKAAEEAAKEWEKTSQLIGDTLADYIMGGGKDAASYLKRLFSTLVLRPVVETAVSGAMGFLGLGGSSGGGGGLLGTASNANTLYNLFSGGAGNMGAISGALGGSMSWANAAGSIYANTTGTGISGLLATNGAYGTAGAGASSAGLGAAGTAAAVIAAPLLVGLIAGMLDKGNRYSGAAYATSGGNDPLAQVISGAINLDVATGSLPDRDAILDRLITNFGAPESVRDLNDRQLTQVLDRMGGVSAPSGYDVDSLDELMARYNMGYSHSGINWRSVMEGTEGSVDFYRGAGYADPNQLGWWGDSGIHDPAITAASRAIAESIVNPLTAISKIIGEESDFRVTTGMRWREDGTTHGGLEISRNGQELVNWGSQEFGDQAEYLRATFSEALGVFQTFDLPNWAQTTVEETQAAMAQLSGENLGQEAATLYEQASQGIATTMTAIERLIKIVPELGGASQDAVFNIGQALGGLEQFTNAYSAYVQNFYSEAERFQYIRDGINDTLSQFDLSVAFDTTREQFRAMVEEQDLMTESGQQAFAALMQVSSAFAEITPVVEEAISELDQQIASMAESIGSDFTGVLTEGLLGNLTGADLGGQMADVVIGGVYNALASNVGNQISEMMMSTVINPLLTAAMTGSSLSEAVSEQAIASMVANAQAAARALGELLSSDAFQGVVTEIEGALRSISGFMPTRSYYTSYQPQAQVKEYTKAVKDSADEAARAAEALRKAWQSISDTLVDEVRRIRGELADAGDQSMAYWQTQFALDTAAARSGDEEAAKRLTEISRSLLDAAARESATMLELQQARAWVAQSLQDTSGYAAAIGSGALSATPTKTTPTTFVTQTPTISAAPVVVAADPAMLVAFKEFQREVMEEVRTIREQQRDQLRIQQRQDAVGAPTYSVPEPV